MYIRKTAKTHKGKTYNNYLLVESLSTPKGPRQKILCSLGSLAPAPREHWLDLAHRVQASLLGRARDPHGSILLFSFFVIIILTYVYVRIGGTLCLIPSPTSNSCAPAS